MKDAFNHICDTDGCSKKPVWRELSQPMWNGYNNPELCDECKVYRERQDPSRKFERLEDAE